jgi:hypothetical protein
VEDGSTDGSGAIGEVLARHDPRVRLLHHPQHANRGASASRNLGMAHARSPFLAFLDADDRYLPHRFHADAQVFRATSGRGRMPRCRGSLLPRCGRGEALPRTRAADHHWCALPGAAGRTLRWTVLQEGWFRAYPPGCPHPAAQQPATHGPCIPGRTAPAPGQRVHFARRTLPAPVAGPHGQARGPARRARRKPHHRRRSLGGRAACSSSPCCTPGPCGKGSHLR